MLTLEAALLIVLLGANVKGQIVDTTHGQVQGQRLNVLGRSVDTYYGIPFAKPPVGDLRFKHPESIETWRPATKDATERKSSCLQEVSNWGGMSWRADMTSPSEDCLYLNVWVPSNRTPGTKLATMIWIYGGSFTSGSINLPLYDGKYLASQNDVIVVGINYRVGVLGFMYIGPDTMPGNMGMMDQSMGIKWVYDNIERFGGDQNMIALFGESAGAASVGHHLLSPLSRDYFTRAILQSGAPNAAWASKTTTEARGDARRFALAVNCSFPSELEMFNCIRQRPSEILLSAQTKLAQTEVVAAPLIDGYFLPENPSTLLKRGAVKKTQILTGYNKDEGTLFLMAILPTIFPPIPDISVSRQQFLTTLDLFSNQLTGNTDLSKPMMSQYADTQVASLRDSYADLADDVLGDSYFKCPATTLSNQVSLWDEVYFYSFEHRLESMTFPNWMGVPHAYEMELMFGHPLGGVLTSSAEEQSLSRAMMTYWTNFAKSGNPNVPNPVSIQWPSYNTTDEVFLVLDSQSRLREQQGPRKSQCVFWNDFVPLLVDTSTLATTTPRVVIMPCVSSGSGSKVTVISYVGLMSIVTILISQLIR